MCSTVQQRSHVARASVRSASARWLHALQIVEVQLQLLAAAMHTLRLTAYDNCRWQQLYATVAIAAVRTLAILAVAQMTVTLMAVT
jgi:hypothetical protein